MDSFPKGFTSLLATASRVEAAVESYVSVSHIPNDADKGKWERQFRYEMVSASSLRSDILIPI